MIHFAMSTERCHPAPSQFSPVTPDQYLQLRRKAAGMSVKEVAGMLARNAGEVAPALDLIYALESPGRTARHPETLEALRSVFPFDPDVYRQLATYPTDQHPRICRGCGCSEWDPCIAGDGTHTCSWQGLATCTRCVGEPVVPVHQ